MERNIQTQAIVLAVRKYGELHKSVTLLCPELGLVDAIIYGGRKGKKTALAPLFSISDMQLYYNPVKKEYSIVEAVSSFIPSSISEDLGSTYAAAFFCEIITKAPSDDSNQTFLLLRDALVTLDNAPTLRKRIIISFIWQLMHIAGTAPNLGFCPSCDKVYGQDEVLYFSSSLSSPCCKSCSDNQNLILPPGARRYLSFTSEKNFLDSVEVELNPAAEERIISYMLKWASIFAQTNLKTLLQAELF